MSRTFDELVAEAEAVSVDGWDFSWLDGRATEQRPSWGYQRAMGARVARASAVLDLETGGGEVLAGSTPTLAPLTVATDGSPPLPFADEAFDLVLSRHPVTTWWDEIARVLRPGGTYFSQQVGPASVFEIVEYFLGPQSEQTRNTRHPDAARRAAEATGLTVVDLRAESLRTEFHDIGAVVYFLRKVVWMVPGFTVDQYRDRLRELHERILAEGPFVARTTRFLIEARKPERSSAPEK